MTMRALGFDWRSHKVESKKVSVLIPHNHLPIATSFLCGFLYSNHHNFQATIEQRQIHNII